MTTCPIQKRKSKNHETNHHLINGGLCNPLTACGRETQRSVLYADDLGYGELGYYGFKEVPTPNIDSIAGQRDMQRPSPVIMLRGHVFSLAKKIRKIRNTCRLGGIMYKHQKFSST